MSDSSVSEEEDSLGVEVKAEAVIGFCLNLKAANEDIGVEVEAGGDKAGG